MALEKNEKSRKPESKNKLAPLANSRPEAKHPAHGTSQDKFMKLQNAIGNRAVRESISSGQLNNEGEIVDPDNSQVNQYLPEDLQNTLESSFKQSFSNVTIHKNSSKAKDLNSLAFTQGTNIHFAPGQFNPLSERGKNLIGHEFTHVVQQRSGAVDTTSVMGKGLKLNSDNALEDEADEYGKMAVRGQSITKYQSPSLGIRNSLRMVQAKDQVIQRAVSTWGGSWDTDQYRLRKNKDSQGNVFPAAAGVRGVDIKLKFTPGKNVDAKLIGLTQTVQGIVNNKPNLTTGAALRDIEAKDAIKINTGVGETDEGTAIDRLSTRNNPIYGSPSLAKGKELGDTPLSNNSSGDALKLGVNATYQLGFRYKSGKNIKKQDAMLFDGPTRSGAAKNSRHIFETTALALKGTQLGTYYGSVRWGWRTDAKSNFTKIPLQVVSQGVPSSTFMKAAGLWNTGKTSTGANTVNLPVVDVKVISSNNTELFSGPVDDVLDIPPIALLPAGTRIRITDASDIMVMAIEVVDGPLTGMRGYISNIGVQFRDERS